MLHQIEIKEIPNHPGIIPVRTRSGNEVHACQLSHGNKTKCGVWLRFPSKKMYINKEVTCEKCLAILEGENAKI